MTISTTTAEASFAGNGSTTAFALGFEVNANSELVVILRSAGGVNTTQTLSTHYTISNLGAESGATVNMVTAPASGETLYAYRRTTITQEASFRPLSDAALTALADKLTKIAQENRAKGDRALVVPIGDSGQVLLPPAATRASKYLSFDSSGNAQVSSLLPGDYSVTAFGQSVLLVADAAALVQLMKEADAYVENASPGITFADTDGPAGTKARIAGNGAGSLTYAADPDDVVANSKHIWEVDGAEAASLDVNGFETNLRYKQGTQNLSHEFLGSLDASASASLSFILGNNSLYDSYEIRLSNIIPATDGEVLFLRFAPDGTTFASGVSDYRWSHQSYRNATATNLADEADSGIRLSIGVGNAANEDGYSGVVILNGVGLAKRTRAVFQGGYAESGTGLWQSTHGSGERLAAQEELGVQFIFSSGNITSGTITVWGLRNS